MKKYLKVVEGSRGEVESLELVETSLELIKEELDKHVEDLKEEGELDLEYIEEFTGCWEDKDSGLHSDHFPVHLDESQFQKTLTKLVT